MCPEQGVELLCACVLQVLLPGFFLATDHAVNFRELQAAPRPTGGGDGGGGGGGLSLSSFSQPCALAPPTTRRLSSTSLLCTF